MSDLSSLERAFYTGDFSLVLGTDTSSLPQEGRQRGVLLSQRALILTGKARDVSTGLGDIQVPPLRATKLYADYVLGESGSVKALEELAVQSSSDDVVKHLAGLVLAAEKRYDDAIELLSTHNQSLDAVLLLTHIYLAQNRLDKAVNLVNQAKKWANDHIIFNIAEAWTALRQGGDGAQKAYYIFEENTSIGPTASSHLGEAVAQLELRRFPEGSEALARAKELEPLSEDVLATEVAVAAINGADTDVKDSPEFQTTVLAQDLREKGELFDKVVARYATA